MPILGADMSAGTLVAWRQKPGDGVKRGDIIATVETDKGVIDVEIFVSGVIEEMLVQPGATVPTGTVLAIIREEGFRPAAPPPAPGVPGRVRISPLAKKLAAELGVDPATVRGTGPGGAITREDIERAARPEPAAEPQRPTVEIDRQDPPRPDR